MVSVGNCGRKLQDHPWVEFQKERITVAVTIVVVEVGTLDALENEPMNG